MGSGALGDAGDADLAVLRAKKMGSVRAFVSVFCGPSQKSGDAQLAPFRKSASPWRGRPGGATQICAAGEDRKIESIGT